MESQQRSLFLPSGFTLIELLIAIAILGILAGIALPSYSSYITQSKIKDAQADLIALSLNIENYFQRYLSYPVDKTTTTTAETKALFSGWSPVQGADFSYTLVSTEKTYTLTATGTSGNLGSCVLKIDQNNNREVTNCKGIISW